MKTDIQICRSTTLQPIAEVASRLGVPADRVEAYGKYKAKIDFVGKKKGKLILVTAINPTKYGEGKTTVSIGLADGMRQLGKDVALALREPSLGPVFGIKGGATGGGYSQIAPMDDINLHFTGDMHAITSANNLLSAMIDNHLFFGNELGIRTVVWQRTMDHNDRALRSIEVSKQGGNAVARADSFVITAASEIMAILTLASDLPDLIERLGRIVIGFDGDDQPITASRLNAHQAMAILLKDAIKPNLVQTLEGTPALVHGGPFANIAHGCNSVIATRTALSLADYVVTEAGFGGDLGAEKFLDIKCRTAGLVPSAVVVVATIRALKASGGGEDTSALARGLANLHKHTSNMTEIFGLRTIVAINRFSADSDEEVELVRSECRQRGVNVECITAWGDGGRGGMALGQAVVDACEGELNLRFAYELEDTLEVKLTKLVTRVYGGRGIRLTERARQSIERLQRSGYTHLPVCVAKTQYSLSDDASLIGCPSDFEVTIRDVELRAGAGFVVAIAGDILLMPGLPKVSNAEKMTITADGIIDGLF